MDKLSNPSPTMETISINATRIARVNIIPDLASYVKSKIKMDKNGDAFAFTQTSPLQIQTLTDLLIDFSSIYRKLDRRICVELVNAHSQLHFDPETIIDPVTENLAHFKAALGLVKECKYRPYMPNEEEVIKFSVSNTQSLKNLRIALTDFIAEFTNEDRDSVAITVQRDFQDLFEKSLIALQYKVYN